LNSCDTCSSVNQAAAANLTSPHHDWQMAAFHRHVQRHGRVGTARPLDQRHRRWSCLRPTLAWMLATSAADVSSHREGDC
jgi:hypothetical protein